MAGNNLLSLETSFQTGISQAGYINKDNLIININLDCLSHPHYRNPTRVVYGEYGGNRYRYGPNT
jgi:hypothetical protein